MYFKNHILLNTSVAVTFTSKSGSLLNDTIYFFIAYLIESFSNFRDMSRRAFIDTSRMFGTDDEHTLNMLFMHLYAYLSPNWLMQIYFSEYIAAILK